VKPIWFVNAGELSNVLTSSCPALSMRAGGRVADACHTEHPNGPDVHADEAAGMRGDECGRPHCGELAGHLRRGVNECKRGHPPARSPSERISAPDERDQPNDDRKKDEWRMGRLLSIDARTQPDCQENASGGRSGLRSR
jgi:hypothetical protein